MKKILLILLAISLMATLFVGCGEEVAPETNDVGDTVVNETEPDAQVQEENSDNASAIGQEKADDETSAVPETKDETPSPSQQENTQQSKPSATEPAKPSTAPNNSADSKPEDKPATTPEKPADKPVANDAPASKPATNKPADKPATTPDSDTPASKPADTTEKPADKPAAKEYSIAEVHTIIKNTYGEDYRPNVEIPRESLSDLFGINLDDVEEFIAEQPMISANIDTFIAIKAKSGKAQSVVGALNAYKNSLLNGAMMYPSNMPKAQAAKVVSHGDYVFFIMLGAAGDMEADEATQLSFAKAQVEKGINAINNYFTK